MRGDPTSPPRPLAAISSLEGRPWAPYVIASILGAAAGLVGFVHTNPWLVLAFVLPDRAPATTLERAVGWGMLFGGVVTYAAVPWLLRLRRWHEPLPPESPWPRAVAPVAVVTLVACWVLLAQGHAHLDQEEPALAPARVMLASAVVAAVSGLALLAVVLRHVRPWAAVATAGVVAACATGPIVVHATSYANEESVVGWALFGGPSLVLLAAMVGVLAAAGGPVRARRLWLGTAVGLALAMLVASVVLLADLGGQAEAARLAHEEASAAPFALLAILLLALAALRRR